MQNYGLIREGKSNAVLKPIAMPDLPDDYLLIRTVAVALNPTDWTTIDAEGDDGTLVGCDYAGIVEEVGKAVTKPFKKGDRVAGFSHGGNDTNPQTGAFARYIIVKGALQMHIPENVSFEVAATVGSGFATSGYALHNLLGFPFPGEKIRNGGEPFLIYGGSTASGTIAIQLAKLAGWKVLTTCSSKLFELIGSRGADQTFDYRAPNVAAQIKASTNDKLTTVFDTVNVESTASICAQAISSSGGTYINLLGLDSPRKDVRSVFFLGYDFFGEPYRFEGDQYPARPELFQWAKDWMSRAETLWAEGKLRPHPDKVLGGGLRGALVGMEEMRQARGPSGEKWVYRVDDTVWSEA